MKNAYGAIDIHAHYYPEQYLSLMATEGSRFGISFSTAHPGGPIINVPGEIPAGPIGPSFIDLEQRLATMDSQGVAVQALSLTQPMVYFENGTFSRKLAAAFNDAVSAAHQAYPERFVGLATLPLQEPRLAAEELERIRALPGIRGVYFGTNIIGEELSQRRLFPIYERIEDQGWPIFLHPVRVIGNQRLETYFLDNLLGNPFETAVAAAHLIFGGVLDAFPKLEVCLPHAGGALPILAGRLDRGFHVRDECSRLPRSPSEYLRRFMYDTIGHSERVINYVVDLVGCDRIMLGSDYCFAMGCDHPVESIMNNSRLTEEQRRLIIEKNAARLLKLER
jgi:aminocarboxymuconate-semialdehyde decarboxylase